MSSSQILTAIGLILNTAAAVVLIVPNLKRTRNLSDDFIVSGDQEKGTYTQRKHLKAQCINIVGLTLLALGFIFQLIGML